MQNVSEKSEGMSIIRQFFNIGKEPEFDIKKRVDEYLLKLPQCSRSVVVVCQKYQETHYRCEIEVAAEKLLPWAVNHSYTVSSTHLEEQAARIALPVWLSRKNSQENSSSYIPFLMHKVLRPYVLDFISDGIADVYCIECNSYVTDIYMQKLDKKKLGGWSSWSDDWRCPVGHQLYHEEQELHFYRSHRKSNKELHQPEIA
jgi:hypothetical protein